MIQSEYKVELFSNAFDDSIFDLSPSNQKQPTYKQANQDFIESFSKVQILDSDIEDKPSPTALINQILENQSPVSANEYLKENVRKKPDSRRTKYSKKKKHNSKHTKYPKRKNLANRSDVLNKCSIRKLRRRFWTMFRAQSK